MERMRGVCTDDPGAGRTVAREQGTVGTGRRTVNVQAALFKTGRRLGSQCTSPKAANAVLSPITTTGTMRIERLIVLGFIGISFAYTLDHPAGVHERPTGAGPHLFDFAQRTCALEVVVRPIAWKEPLAFGRAIDDNLVRPNLEASRTLLACAAVPSAVCDTSLAVIR